MRRVILGGEELFARAWAFNYIHIIIMLITLDPNEHYDRPI